MTLEPIDPIDPLDPIDALARELPPPAVPAGFADAVLAKHAVRTRRTRATRAGLAIAAAAAACSALAVLLVTDDVRGARTATGIETVALGDDATVVLDPGAALAWHVDDALGLDTIAVEQTVGRAFFRVTPGASLTVRTPAGDVVVRGTCFSVDVSSSAPAKDTPMAPALSGSMKTLATTTAGAVAGAVLSVLVFEGSVDVRNDHGSARAQPGEEVRAAAGAPPRREHRAQPTALADAVSIPRAEIEALRAAASSTPDTAALVRRNRELEENLAKAREEPELVDAVKRAEEGEPAPFPPDLPARFQGAEMQRAFEAALDEVGVKGGVIEVDCSEYPCTIYGQLTTREDMDKLRKSQALAPYATDSNSTSVWGTQTKRDGVDVKETYFGVQLVPEGTKPTETEEKRQERRLRDGWERIRPQRE